MLLCLPMQRYKFESNSQQKEKKEKIIISCVYLCKDTNLKAIHNVPGELAEAWRLCLPMQRYKFESNSQLIIVTLLGKWSCVYLCKDTNLKAIHNTLVFFHWVLIVVFTYAKIQIWKQFTTHRQCLPLYYQLCLPMQRYKFESNSQPTYGQNAENGCCVYLCKDTNLKAIHNRGQYL